MNIKKYTFLDDYLLKIPDRLVEMIKSSKNIAVLGHYDPDGDVIGSQLGLELYLKSAGYKVDSINQGPFNFEQKKYKSLFLKNIEKEYDLYIVVDTPDLERIGCGGIIKKDKIVVIDHHITNSNFGVVNWIDDFFVSTAEMILLLIIKLGFELNNVQANQLLLNGVCSDTGFFQHSRKEKNFSFLASYILTENGADPKISYEELYGSKTLASKKLLALVLSRIESISDGEILWTYITDQDRREFNNSQIESFYVFREMLNISTAKICIFFKEYNNKIDVSFRSYDKVDVAKLAKLLGGGGHKAASGVSFENKKFLEIKDEVLKKALEYVKIS